MGTDTDTRQAGQGIIVTVIGALVIALFAGLVGAAIDGDSEGLGEANFPPGGPAEFLYLDDKRVDYYLAQVNGGDFDAETVIRKLSEGAGAKVTAPGVGEGNGSRTEEASVQRELKPTDASSFFALKNGLEDEEELHEVHLRAFGEDVRELDPGSFVIFKTAALLSPLYLNAFLALRQDQTVTAMFPDSPKRRAAAKRFATSVGPDPRIVFALQPPKEGTFDELEPFVYLLPINAARLTTERSLIKYGGGRFTVVGKVVRIFPEKQQDHTPAYVDSATRETWERPLHLAPRELLCRADAFCIARVRQKERELERRLAPEARMRMARVARTRALEKLDEQTQIEDRGAVILPIAIYRWGAATGAAPRARIRRRVGWWRYGGGRSRDRWPRRRRRRGRRGSRAGCCPRC